MGIEKLHRDPHGRIGLMLSLRAPRAKAIAALAVSALVCAGLTASPVAKAKQKCNKKNYRYSVEVTHLVENTEDHSDQIFRGTVSINLTRAFRFPEVDLRFRRCEKGIRTILAKHESAATQLVRNSYAGRDARIDPSPSAPPERRSACNFDFQLPMFDHGLSIHGLFGSAGRWDFGLDTLEDPLFAGAYRPAFYEVLRDACPGRETNGAINASSLALQQGVFFLNSPDLHAIAPYKVGVLADAVGSPVPDQVKKLFDGESTTFSAKGTRSESDGDTMSASVSIAFTRLPKS